MEEESFVNSGEPLTPLTSTSKSHVIIRTEDQVGILARVGSSPRFSATFKERYSDFHVNEIDSSGSIVHLTSLGAIQQSHAVSDTNTEEIEKLISEDVRVRIREIGGLTPETKTSTNQSVHIKVSDLDKDQRTKIHKWLNSFETLYSETVEKDNEKFIVASFKTKNKANRRHERRPANRARFTHCVLYKEGLETSQAINFIAKKLNIKPNLISYAGTKDKQAKTTQRICISNIDSARLVELSNYSKNSKLGNFEYLPHSLHLGELKGNHFKILLKNVCASSEESIREVVDSLSRHGFINYFGLQRFGSYEVSTHDIGKAMLQMKWLEAIDLILAIKESDSPFVKEAKEIWFKNRDANQSVKCLPHWFRSIESNLLHGLAKHIHQKDYFSALQCIPRNTRTLYLHAFQSYLWNRLASIRVKEQTLTPQVGDLVYQNPDTAAEMEDFAYEDEEPSNSNTAQPPTTNTTNLQKPNVVALTEDNLKNYSIYDIVIPLPGTEVIYPENMRIQLDELLVEEGLQSDCFMRFGPKNEAPKGAYRKLFQIPMNVACKIGRYDRSDCLDSVIPSEIDILENPTPNEKEETTVLDSVKECMYVVIELSLASSSYATMALREILCSNDEMSSSPPQKRQKLSNPKSD